jgi:hypothetical protein
MSLLVKWIFIIIILLIPMIPTFLAIIDLLPYKVKNNSYSRSLWLLFVIFIPPLGGICYLVLKKLLKQRKNHA